MKLGYVSINDNIFSTLLALSEEEQQQGLMWQEWMPPIMSFVYAQPRINKFWMHNTPSPLDLVFCYNNQITQIHRGTPFSTEMIGDNTFSDLIIEYPAGMVKDAGIQIGQKVKLFKPTLAEIKKLL